MRIEKKVQRKYFKAVIEDRKRFEVRLADFKCKLGDILVLKEQDPQTKKLTGRKRKIECEVLYKFNTKEIENITQKNK
jgi:hypothetical protein